ncbi:uncharacterized protein [Littorina saxatilis]
MVTLNLTSGGLLRVQCRPSCCRPFGGHAVLNTYRASSSFTLRTSLSDISGGPYNWTTSCPDPTTETTTTVPSTTTAAIRTEATTTKAAEITTEAKTTSEATTTAKTTSTQASPATTEATTKAAETTEATTTATTTAATTTPASLTTAEAETTKAAETTTEATTTTTTTTATTTTATTSTLASLTTTEATRTVTPSSHTEITTLQAILSPTAAADTTSTDREHTTSDNVPTPASGTPIVTSPPVQTTDDVTTANDGTSAAYVINTSSSAPLRGVRCRCVKNDKMNQTKRAENEINATKAKEAIQEELTINRKSLSSYKRSKESWTDERKSSTTIGATLGIICVAVVFVVFVKLDLMNVIKLVCDARKHNAVTMEIKEE